MLPLSLNIFYVKTKLGAVVMGCSTLEPSQQCTVLPVFFTIFKTELSSLLSDSTFRCFDMGFAPQIEMVLQNIRPDRQTVLFSATFPKQIEKLAKTVKSMQLCVLLI